MYFLRLAILMAGFSYQFIAAVFWVFLLGGFSAVWQSKKHNQGQPIHPYVCEKATVHLQTETEPVGNSTPQRRDEPDYIPLLATSPIGFIAALTMILSVADISLFLPEPCFVL